MKQGFFFPNLITEAKASFLFACAWSDSSWNLPGPSQPSLQEEYEINGHKYEIWNKSGRKQQ